MNVPTLITRPSIRFLLVATALAWVGPAACQTPPACTMVSGGDLAAIQKAINEAAPGDIVCLESGRSYRLDKPLLLKNGVSLAGRGPDGSGERAVFDAGAKDELLLIQVVREGLVPDPFVDVSITGIEFDNVGFYFAGLKERMDIRDIELADNVFRNGKVDRTTGVQSPEFNSFYVRAKYMSGITIKGNQFLRTADTHGRGVQLYAAHFAAVIDNHFGCSAPDCEDADRFGHFKTTVNVLGYDGNAPIDTGCEDPEEQAGRSFCIDISRNKMMRDPAIPSNGQLEDHGLYAYAVKNLNVSKNNISGWSPQSTGGSIVVRNAECVNIMDNKMARSGIALFTRGPSKKNPIADGPLHLLYVAVNDNEVDAGPGPNGDLFYSGISYWRQYLFGNEYDIVIADNKLENGAWGWWKANPKDGPQANRYGHLQDGASPGDGPRHRDRRATAAAFVASVCER